MSVGSKKARAELVRKGLRPVLMTEGLAAALADRVEWGEPDEDGWYSPTFRRADRCPVCDYQGRGLHSHTVNMVGPSVCR